MRNPAAPNTSPIQYSLFTDMARPAEELAVSFGPAAPINLNSMPTGIRL
jgi:hypothetical protein